MLKMHTLTFRYLLILFWLFCVFQNPFVLLKKTQIYLDTKRTRYFIVVLVFSLNRIMICGCILCWSRQPLANPIGKYLWYYCCQIYFLPSISFFSPSKFLLQSIEIPSSVRQIPSLAHQFPPSVHLFPSSIRQFPSSVHRNSFFNPSISFFSSSISFYSPSIFFFSPSTSV